MSNLFDTENNGAAFSDCRTHRFALWRIWDDSKPLVMFIGLNPSTANEDTPDNTIKRVRAIANQLGYGGFYMMNLFTYVSTDPAKLDKDKGNLSVSDNWLFRIGSKCKTIVFAWGNFKVHGRDKEIKAMFPRRWALRLNKNGSPMHPLFCRKDTQLIRY